MTKVSATVKIDLSGLIKYREVLNQDLRGQSAGPVRVAMRQWAVRYRSFTRERFVSFSRGGGDWPPLKSKRRKGAIGSAALLRDTGLLFGALSPTFSSKPGQLQRDERFGVRVGFGGPGRYPTGVSIVDVAGWHQSGAGNLPVRRIIVSPDDNTVRQMSKDMERALIKLRHKTIDGQ